MVYQCFSRYKPIVSSEHLQEGSGNIQTILLDLGLEFTQYLDYRTEEDVQFERRWPKVEAGHKSLSELHRHLGSIGE